MGRNTRLAPTRRASIPVAGLLVLAFLAGSAAFFVTQAAGSPAPDPLTGKSLRTPPGVIPNQVPPGNSSSNLIQGSGKVMTNPVVYNVFWLPGTNHYEADGLASSDTRYENLLNRFFTDVGATNYYNMVTQYAGSNGTPVNAVAFGGSFVDTATPYPHAGSQADPIFDTDIRSEATHAASVKGWTQDGNHIYMVYTAFNIFQCQTGTSDCNFFKSGHTNAYCAYHNSFNSGNDIYSFMGDDSMFGDPGGCSVGVAPNNDAAADAEISTAAHEFIESVTDPNIDNWLSSVATGQQEIGDLCNRNDGPRNAISADVYLHGNPYDVQQMWSNAVSGCAMDLNGPKTSDVPPVLTFTKTADTTAVTGQAINYTITVTNPSDTDASTLTTVTDALPAGVTYVAGSGTPAPVSTSPPTWDLGTVAVHDTSTITFQGRASGPGSPNNCATVNYDDMLQIAAQTPETSCASTTVTKASTSTALTSSANPAVYGQPVTLTATVTVNPPGTASPPPSSTVTFFDNGIQIGTGTLNQANPDVATLSTSALTVGDHPITATYGGDPKFIGSASGIFHQIVNKAPTTTVVVSSGSPSNFGTSVTFTATVTPAPPSTAPTVLPSGTFTFSVDGTPFASAPVNQPTGTGAFSTSNLLPGTHTIQANYGGDGNFLASSAQTTQTVTCVNNITGNVPGTLILGAGTTCITGATVGGGIIANGATLFISNSTVGGSVQMTGSPMAGICSSTVHGSLSIKNSTGFVVVGDPGDDGCGGNTVIGGAVILSNNHGDVELISNKLPSLNLSGTTGTGPFAEDTQAEIESNQIAGSVTCSGNAPAPTNDAHANTIGGSRTGQCSSV